MAPVITGFEPTSASRCEPTTIVLTGTGFSDVTDVACVFYLAPEHWSIDSDTQITLETEGNPIPGLTATAIQVEAPSGIFNTEPTVGSVDWLDDLPVITGIDPSSGPANTATPILIQGSNFLGVDLVRLGGYDLVFTVDSDIQISAVTPDFIGDDTVFAQAFRNLCFSEPVAETAQFVFGTGIPPDPDPDPDAPEVCLVVDVPTLTLDSVAPDADGVVYTVQAIDGWFDSPPVRSGELELNPRGVSVPVARENGRVIDVQVLAHALNRQTALGAPLCFAAMRTIKTAFRAVYASIPMTVADPSGLTRQARVRRAGPIKVEILGECVSVKMTIPLLAGDPRLVLL